MKKVSLLIAVVPVYVSNQIHPILKLHVEVSIYRFVIILYDVHGWYGFTILSVEKRLYLMQKCLVVDSYDFTVFQARINNMSFRSAGYRCISSFYFWFFLHFLG